MPAVIKGFITTSFQNMQNTKTYFLCLTDIKENYTNKYF